MPENEVEKKPERVAIEQPAPAQAAPPKKADPVEDLADTVDQFFTSVQSAGMRSLKSMLAQFMQKADAAITKLDENAGGVPPKKVSPAAPPTVAAEKKD